jgi:hypothetical protein
MYSYNYRSEIHTVMRSLIINSSANTTSSYHGGEVRGHVTRTEESINTYTVKKTRLNSVALVRKQTIPTERPPLVGEGSANFCG